jgi:hypothetical protein
MSLLLIGSSHAPLDVLCAASLQTFGVFQQPARQAGVAEWQTRRTQNPEIKFLNDYNCLHTRKLLT